MLVATDLTKFYGLRPVLRKVSLTVARGEFVAILGPNGAGKTTLLRVLATLARPDGGKLSIGGADVLLQPQQARAQIGMVSHEPLVYPDLTAYENLSFYARMYGVGRNLEQSIVTGVLERVDLQRRAHEPVRTFSRGMVQRLAIGRAILHDPALLLLDEPYTGLDQTSANRLNTLLRELAVAGRAVVMTTHEYNRGLEGITRAVYLNAGVVARELLSDITPETLNQLIH
ncbi:MAG TPA: heme ABC exporter ATP-binding protein CcmA [Anaerolineae bacterium]|jgi:heme exporter protein A